MALLDPTGREIVYASDGDERFARRYFKDPNGHYIPGMTLVDYLGQAIGMDGKLPLWVGDMMLQLARNTPTPGKLPGMIRVNIRGNNPDVDTTTTPEEIWGAGGVYSFPSAATAMEAVSDNVNDTNGGTGARELRINYLDDSWNPATQQVIMNGTTPVNLSVNPFRINQVRIDRVGSLLDAAGNIRIRAQGGGTTYAYIPVGEGFSSHGVYTVRAGYTLFLVASLFSIIPKTRGDTVVLLQSRQSMNAEEPWRTRWRIPLTVDGTSAGGFPTVIPHPMNETTDLRFRVSFVSANDMEVSCHVQGIMIDNTI